MILNLIKIILKNLHEFIKINVYFFLYFKYKLKLKIDEKFKLFKFGELISFKIIYLIIINNNYCK